MFDAIVHATIIALGLRVAPQNLGAGQMALRALVVYVAGLGIVRLAKKRFMSHRARVSTLR